MPLKKGTALKAKLNALLETATCPMFSNGSLPYIAFSAKLVTISLTFSFKISPITPLYSCCIKSWVPKTNCSVPFTVPNLKLLIKLVLAFLKIGTVTNWVGIELASATPTILSIWLTRSVFLPAKASLNACSIPACPPVSNPITKPP